MESNSIMIKEILVVKRAWVVMWERHGNSSKEDKKIISFFDYRIGENEIKHFVEGIYADSQYTINERLFYLKYPRKNPYRAKFSGIAIITCGHNPFVIAKMVLNLCVINGKVNWDEINRKSIREEIEQHPQLALKMLPN